MNPRRLVAALVATAATALVAAPAAHAAPSRAFSVHIAIGSNRPVRAEGTSWTADKTTAGGKLVRLDGAKDALTSHARVGQGTYTLRLPRTGAYRVTMVVPGSSLGKHLAVQVNGSKIDLGRPRRSAKTVKLSFPVKVKSRTLTLKAARGSSLTLSGLAVAATTDRAPVVTPTAPVVAAPVTVTTVAPEPAAAASATPAAPAAARNGTVSWASGVWTGGNLNTAAANSFAAFRGRAVDVAATYTDWSSWSNFANSTWYLDTYKDFPGTLSIGVPLVAPGGDTLADVASGKDDWAFTSFARNLVAANRGTSYVRLGWEFDGDWIPWAAKDAPSFVAAFRHAVDVIRAEAPGVRIVWNGTLGESHVGHNPFTELYPGDAYVDVVGVDAYDTQWHSATDAGSWKSYLATTNGLSAWLDFAKAHGKLFAAPEWGLNDQSSTSARDDAFYIRSMHDFFAANAGSLAYEAYFNEPDSYIQSSLVGPNQNPAASSAYAAAWAAQG